jgi:hypothetical protein
MKRTIEENKLFLGPEELGFQFPRILVPNQNIDLRKWSIIACDQFTSEPEVWKRLEAEIGSAPSTLHCILPECYLGTPEEKERIPRIHQTLKEYLSQGILEELEPGIMLVERTTPYTLLRRGIVVAMDLDKYDYRPGTQSLIRPTEETILERLPPRVRIRKGAAIEFPHILVLLNDRDTRVVEALFSRFKSIPYRYKTNLPLDAGEIRGRFIPQGQAEKLIVDLLSRTYQAGSFFYAVGDGNHSLAAAKQVWEEQKSPEARYALVELVSVYDPGIRFEPIHRIVFSADWESWISHLRSLYRMELRPVPSYEAMKQQVEEKPHRFGLLHAGTYWIGELYTSSNLLLVEPIQTVLDAYCDSHPGVKVDYIHGEDTLRTLCQGNDALGIFLPGILKEEFFPLIESRGVLPRKAFSIGKALEKRFYFEGRRILPISCLSDSEIP